jgi:hypothetical protein
VRARGEMMVAAVWTSLLLNLEVVTWWLVMGWNICMVFCFKNIFKKIKKIYCFFLINIFKSF